VGLRTGNVLSSIALWLISGLFKVKIPNFLEE
jgi:hypothetical protein